MLHYPRNRSGCNFEVTMDVSMKSNRNKGHSLWTAEKSKNPAQIEVNKLNFAQQTLAYELICAKDAHGRFESIQTQSPFCSKKWWNTITRQFFWQANGANFLKLFHLCGNMCGNNKTCLSASNYSKTRILGWSHTSIWRFLRIRLDGKSNFNSLVFLVLVDRFHRQNLRTFL